QRMHWVLSRRKHANQHQTRFFLSVEQVIQSMQACNQEEFFVVGGGEIYKIFLPYTQFLYITDVETSLILAYTFFPKIIEADWKTLFEVQYTKDAKHRYNFRHRILERRATSIPGISS